MVCLPVPDGIAEQDEWGLVFHLIVAGLVQKHLVSMAAQQIGFLSKDLVFAAGRLIRIVHRENLHRINPFACCRWRG